MADKTSINQLLQPGEAKSRTENYAIEHNLDHPSQTTPQGATNQALSPIEQTMRPLANVPNAVMAPGQTYNSAIDAVANFLLKNGVVKNPATMPTSNTAAQPVDQSQQIREQALQQMSNNPTQAQYKQESEDLSPEIDQYNKMRSKFGNK